MEESRIKELVEQALEDASLFLVDVKIKGNTGNQKVLIFVDGDNGISIDQCSKISRKVGLEMEEMDLMQDKYTLEVSSPGLDFPLTLHRQYVKNVGRALSLETLEGEKLEGELKQVNNDSILLGLKNEDRSIALEEVKQSKVIVSFK